MEVRFNSPHGKFKRTDMADNQADLTSEVDIPRTNFIEKEIDKFTIAQLILMLIFILISIIILYFNQNGNKKNYWKGRCIIQLCTINQLF